MIAGNVAGGVITFLDISQRKEKEEAIRYQYYHDELSGLFNRRFFEENRHSMDVPDKLPLSVIYADINVLKLTNDIFGHEAGDELIRKFSEVLLQVCGEKGVIMRVGGDEFVIFLPNTHSEETAGILARIREGIRNTRVEAIKCSISLGSDTKINEGQSLDVVMANAENAMYKDKTMNRQSVNKDVIDTIAYVLFSKNDGERRHAEAVGQLSIEMGLSIGLSDAEISKLQRAALLHDIGKITLDTDILAKDTLVALTEEEHTKMQQHPVVGYRILNLFDDTLDIAEYIYGHHERWDGKGYPRGLQGEEIPLISRIIAVAETYDRVLHRNDLAPGKRRATAAKAIMDGVGKQFDPDIAERFVELIKREDRG
jgi:diguanylate cyclase (GGDEF)-like protein/putative nucleotidyltransferase with HDIG domain